MSSRASSTRLTDGAALVDALRYPLNADALTTLTALTLCYLIAGFVPILGLLLQLVVWASAYRYALEVLTASGQGRSTPPQGSMLTDVGIARRHAWLQALLIVGLLFAGVLLGPQMGLALLMTAALIMPGALLAMCATQNMLAAINPAAWLAVFGIVGPRYLLMAVGVAATLLIQLLGLPWFRTLPLGGLLFFAVVFYSLVASFRLMGTTLHAHAEALGHEQASASGRPILVRDKENQSLAKEAAEAATITDPSKRAAALAPLIRRGGASDALQRDYRQCLRDSDQLDELREHANVRICELVALSQGSSALALATEALSDHGDFALADAEPTLAVSQAAAHAGQLRLAAALCSNYFAGFPKRRDAFPLACRAAALLADRLGDREGARAQLQTTRDALGNRPESAEVERLLLRLEAGASLAVNSASDTVPLSRP